MSAGQVIQVKLLSGISLLPDAWRALGEAPLHVFNPGLLRWEHGWLMACRVVGHDGARRIAMCRLSNEFVAIQGSQTAFSDQIRFRRAYPNSDWFADPRLLLLGSRYFLHWNSGWHEPQNFQFLQEFDPATLDPIGEARELQLIGERRAIEKNWMVFGDDPFFAVYSVNPHRILSLDLNGTGDIGCREVAESQWPDGPAFPFGELRGGAPPQRTPQGYVSLCHSVFGEPGSYDYVASAYRFSAHFPFHPTHAPARPLELAALGRNHPALNPAVRHVIYPCGLVSHEKNWIVSFGINDEQAAIAVLPHDELDSSLQPLPGT